MPAPILFLDDDVLLIFGEKVEEESGIVAVAALASSCHAFATLLQPQATALKTKSLAALEARLSVPLSAMSHARWGRLGLTDVDCRLAASEWMRPGGPLAASLTSLNLSDACGGPPGTPGTPNTFGVRGVRALAAAVPNLTALASLTLDSPVPPELLQGGAPSTLHLAGARQLTTYMVGLLTANNPKLRRLKLGEGKQSLPVRDLVGRSGMQKMDFSGADWQLGALSGLALGGMLASNTHLVWLDLSHNFMAAPGRGVAWAGAVAHALRGAAALRTLKLRFCALCVEGGIELANALRTTRALTLLDLRDNELLTPVASFDDGTPDRSERNTDAVRALIAALRVNATLATPLATLRLDNNGLPALALERLRRAGREGLKITG